MGLLRPDPLLVVGRQLSPDLIAGSKLVPSSATAAEVDAFLEATPYGTVLRRWDYVAAWDDGRVLKPSQIAPLRQQSDDLADAVVEALDLAGKGAGRDGLKACEEYLEQEKREMGDEEWEGRKQDDPVAKLWEEMASLPPGVLDASGGGKEKRFTPLEAFEDAPADISLAEGQRVFWKYSSSIFTALMHFSLAGGFSSPKLSAVMRETNYLTSDAREATYKRLLETTLFVLDAMSDMRPISGRGWRSTFRVRLLHAQVRRRIARGKGKYNMYDVAVDGVPINQSDLVVVLGAFSIAPIWTMRRMGLRISQREIDAYHKAWVHVGYYLGVSASLLSSLYCESFEQAETIFASLAYSVYPTGPPPPDPLKTPQYKILSAVACRPPRGQPVDHHVALCRLCLGKAMADQLALPQGSWIDHRKVDVEVWTSWALLAFGQTYARFGGKRGKQWEARRQKWMRRVLELLVVWQLGERRTVFAWREAEKHHEKLEKHEGEEPELEFGKHIGMAVKKDWAALMVEMGVVVGGVVVLSSAALVGAVRSTSFPTSSILNFLSMSWRASPARTAPPVTSGAPSRGDAFGSSGSAAYDSLFAGPSSSSSSSTPHRTLSSSSSAYSLLSRKMAEVESQDDDDRVSIRSGRSVASRFRGSGGGQSGEGTATGRSRAASTASSVRTARGWSGDAIDEEGDVKMEAVAEEGGKGRGKEAEGVPGSAPTPTKRARLRPPNTASDAASICSRRSSYLAPPGAAVSSARATLSTTTADDLMPSMKTKPHRAASVTSARSSARGAGARPSMKASGSSSTIKPSTLTESPSSSSTLSPAPQETPAASDPPTPLSSSPERIAPIPRSTSTTSSLARRSWFGRTPASVSLANPATSTSFVDESLPKPSSPLPDPAPNPPSSAALEPAIPTSAASPNESHQSESGTIGTAASRGWLSLLARSKPSNLDLAGEAAAQPARMDVDESAEGDPEEGEVTPPATPKAGRTDGDTLRGTLSTEEAAYDDDTLTRKTAVPPASRASWFTWRRSSSTEVVPGAPQGELTASMDAAAPASEAEGTALVPAQNGEVQPDFESALTPQPVESTAEGRGWLSLRSLWGAASGDAGQATTDALTEQRKREAWALKLAAKNSQRLIEAVPEEGEAMDNVHAEATTAPIPTAGGGELRHKPSGSWSLFSRTPVSSSPVAKSTLSSFRTPLASLGVTSSAASTRSRTSSRADTTAPSSPQLRPQSDEGPVKPLTGSIRASTSPRQRSTAAFEPPSPIENLVLPSFDDSFLRPPRSFEPRKSTLNKAVSAVASTMSAYLFHRVPDEAEESLSPLQQAQQAAGVKVEGVMREMQDDPAERLPKVLEAVGESTRREKVKRVVCIGIHGWFSSNALVTKVLGEPTGTSVKFATMMHDAVQSYLESHDVGSFNIQAIALEGQGTVEGRVNKLYNQLVGRDEWVQALTRADAVFIATHSQGSVVSTQLVARMLDQGLIVGTQTHLLAMCGIAQGPFVYLYQSLALAPYFNYVESAPARELFEFQNPESVAAIKFVESLRLVLNAGVKMTVIGSINDQVVPLYSALFSSVDHPGILRAVYIDGEAFLQSDFLANLVVFAARLRNAGLSDHDLVYHVSEALAGALTGVGHSKIYEESAIFNLAVRYHFEVTTLTEPPTQLDTLAPPPPLAMSFNPRDQRNPYLATWALRGIVEDPQVRELFGAELVALQEAYETWRPQTKVLKDVKLKLEGIRLLRKSGKL
ncbi:hypothetical protein JCM8547_002584 [Rhodosporidiobolus lusitaniae]